MDNKQITIEDRYKSSHTGGAFDAKSVGVIFSNNISDSFADGFTRGGQNTNFPKKDSILLKGFSNKKYKG